MCNSAAIHLVKRRCFEAWLGAVACLLTASACTVRTALQQEDVLVARAHSVSKGECVRSESVVWIVSWLYDEWSSLVDV